MSNQRQHILSDLKSGRRITALDALKAYGCFRLGARIYELKQMGHNIKSRLVERINRDGQAVRVAEYWIEADHEKA